MALGKSRKEKKKFIPPKLQITSMMDMFTIILIFLLLSYSDNPENMSLNKDLKLPESSAKLDYKESLKLVVSSTALQLEGETVAKIKKGKILGLNPDNLKSSALYRELRARREKFEQSKETSNESDMSQIKKGDKDHILFLCDKRLNFKTINNIIKTAGMAGYPNFQFAVLKK